MEEIRGFSIPFRIGPGGGIARASGAAKIKENIIHILLTAVGERAMRRDYGSGIGQMVHDPNNDALRTIVQHQIARSIGQWEPRVILQSVTVTQEDGILFAKVDYVERRARQHESISVPLPFGGV